MTYVQYMQKWQRDALVYAYKHGTLMRGAVTQKGMLHKKTALYLIKRGMISQINDSTYVLTELGYAVAHSLSTGAQS